MISFTSEFSDGVINANSSHSADPSELWHGSFDFALLGASWDRRCTAVTKCNNLKFHSAVVLKPDGMDPQGLVNVKTISDFCHANSDCLNIVKSKTSNLLKTLAELRTLFGTEVGRVNRVKPLRVFIDITTCPRYFSLSMLSDAFRSGLVAEIVLAYSDGKYPDATPSYNNLEEISFTEGVLQAVPIPGFLGEFEPSKGKFFLVSIGFDGWKTLNLMIRKEPERVAALLASPGAAPDYERRTLVANTALIERYGIDENELIRATAGDAVEAWQKITNAALENLDGENVYYLCSGNKPHSLALALRAMSIGIPTLLYNRPTRHLPIDVDFTGTYWAYSIKPSVGTVLG